MNNCNKNFNIFLVFGLVLLLIPFVSAEYSPHKLQTNLEFSITSNNGTQCNVTSLDYPEGSISINKIMNRTGQTFNTSFSESYFNTTGNYCLNLVCTDGSLAIFETGSKCVEVTPSGSQINSGKSISIFGSLILMIGLSLVFFIIGFKSESNVAKISFYSFSGIVLMMAILYTVIIMQQTLFGFDSILVGIETFWFVVKMLMWIGFLAAGISIFLIMLKAWKIKRGLIDID